MKTDVIVIGAGVSGLSAAALLAKRGLQVTVIEQGMDPGGSCGSFKRHGATFDQGAAMLYGFGKQGYNAHRFLFNCLEEPFEVIRHELLYTILWQGQKIRFYADIDRFTEELSRVFPQERHNIKRFYHDMEQLYQKVMVADPDYTTPDETTPLQGLRKIARHPLAYLRFLGYMNQSAEALLKQYFNDPELFCFFDKLTSTYCYATVKEAPAILASVMFVDNHTGGSYYPAGSSMYLPNKLEKVIEEHGGTMLYHRLVKELLFEHGTPCGVRLADNQQLLADEIIYSGTVWNLYEQLLPESYLIIDEKERLAKQEATYPSVVLYALVKQEVIDPDTAPIEMLIGNKDAIDESEITVYLLSLDDHTLCAPAYHTVVAIGPSFCVWSSDATIYAQQKKAETERLLTRLNERFPGFLQGVKHAELATPKTIERFTLKNHGAVAGPKQMLGQHMLLRQHIRTRWPSLFCCGESTVLGTGTPTVTTSGIAVANAVLRKKGLAPYCYQKNMRDYVTVYEPPYTGIPYAKEHTKAEVNCMKLARQCQYCLAPTCANPSEFNIRGIMRRISCGNFLGAGRLLKNSPDVCKTEQYWQACQQNCILNRENQEPTAIAELCSFLLSSSREG